MILPLLALAALTAAPAPVPPAAYEISGTVVEERTNQPLRHALVTISQNDHPQRSVSLYTAADGRFRFTDVPRAKYTLQAKAHGEVRSFEQDGQYSTGIVAGPGLDSTHLVFRFPASGSISIKAADTDGDTANGAHFILFARRINSGWPQVEMAGQSSAGEDGTVRFPHLEPGTYYLAAFGRPWYAHGGSMPGPLTQEQRTEQARIDVAYPVTYYASSGSAESAAPIMLAAGENVQLQMTLRVAPTMKVLIPGGNPAHSFFTSNIEAVGPGGVRFRMPGVISQGPDGVMEVTGFAPGNYFVSLYNFNVAKHQPLFSGGSQVSGEGEVTLNPSELVHTTVSGRIALEPPQKVGKLTLLLTEPETGQGGFCRIEANGDFQCTDQSGTMRNTPPGYYQLQLANAPDLYLKSVRAQGGRMVGGLLEVREGDSIQLNLVAGKGSMNLDGIALANGRPYAAAMVLLVPRDNASGIGIPRDQSDSDGTFTLQNVHPGRYYLVAIDHGRGLAYHDPRVIAPYLVHAQTVDISAGFSQRVIANVQPRLR